MGTCSLFLESNTKSIQKVYFNLDQITAEQAEVMRDQGCSGVFIMQPGGQRITLNTPCISPHNSACRYELHQHADCSGLVESKVAGEEQTVGRELQGAMELLQSQGIWDKLSPLGEEL